MLRKKSVKDKILEEIEAIAKAEGECPIEEVRGFYLKFCGQLTYHICKNLTSHITTKCL